MIPTSFPPAAEMARLTARMLLEIKAVQANPLRWRLACPHPPISTAAS
jgi:hypothetical protein